VSAWRGVYWARWNDAVAEAGLEPNTKTVRFDEQFVLGKIAESCRHFGKMPTFMEFRIYRKTHPDFPNDRGIANRYRTMGNLRRALAAWASPDESRADITMMLAGRLTDFVPEEKKRPAEGHVYLIRWGANAACFC
jgi:hypothetical protein